MVIIVLIVLSINYFAVKAFFKDPNPNVLSPLDKLVDNHGYWCGHFRGGWDDCCMGLPCPACIAAQGLVSPTAECLKECPPADTIDLACAKHHFCRTSKQFPRLHYGDCVIEGNPCGCDCALVMAANAVSIAESSGRYEKFYAVTTARMFNNVTACRFNNECWQPPHSFPNSCEFNRIDEL